VLKNSRKFSSTLLTRLAKLSFPSNHCSGAKEEQP